MRSEMDEIAHGTAGAPPESHDIQREIGRYVVTVRLTPTNEFVDIVQVAVNKDFLSPQQRVSESARLDAARFYEED